MKNDSPEPPFVSVPRETFQDSLAKAGYPGETPESFLSRTPIRAELKKDNLIQQAAKVANWSRVWLLISAISSLLFLFGSLDLEGILTLAALTVMTVVEFRVHQGLVEGKVDSLRTGWMNQCGFALWFLIYGAYHFFAPPPPISPWLMNLLDAGYAQIMASIMPFVVFWTKIFYAAVGLAGGIGQLMLARYYRSAFQKVESPPPLLDGE